jgi:hypothetical protein
VTVTRSDRPAAAVALAPAARTAVRRFLEVVLLLVGSYSGTEWMPVMEGSRVRYGVLASLHRERPYHAERTGSHSNAEVKLCRARLVLARGTSWEP